MGSVKGICRRAGNDAEKYKDVKFVGEVGDPSKETRECNMCGDVGFVSELIFCKRCNSRHQHTYCSKLYPDLDMEAWACDWCLYEEEKKKIKPGKGKVAENNNNNRGRAFEFLLQIVKDEPGCEQYHKKIHGESPVCSSKNVGACPSPKLQDVSISKEKKMEIPKINTPDFVVGSFARSPKKQHRSGSGRSPNDGWRRVAKNNKLHCNTASSRVIGRRYKLLADVLC